MGPFFSLYHIKVSRFILSSMNSKGPKLENIVMKMVGGSKGLDFLVPEQREVIIADIEKKGRDSLRRLSSLPAS